MLSFEVWLLAQEVRKDFVGDFACFWGKQVFPPVYAKRKVNEHKKWADLVCHIAQPRHITAFNAAWQEFILARDAEEDRPE